MEAAARGQSGGRTVRSRHRRYGKFVDGVTGSFGKAASGSFPYRAQLHSFRVGPRALVKCKWDDVNNVFVSNALSLSVSL